jgi:hypothetical protein
VRGVRIIVRLLAMIVRQLRDEHRQLSLILERLDHMSTQNEEVRALVDQLGSDQAAQDQAISDVAADVSFLKDKLAQLPTGEPLDPQVVADLQERADHAHTIAQALSDLAGQTDSTGVDPGL